MSSTRTLVTLLRPWIRRFTIIISAWWLRTSSKFTWEEVKTSTGKLGKWSTPKRVRIRPKHSAPSLSRDGRIKMHQSINQSINFAWGTFSPGGTKTSFETHFTQNLEIKKQLRSSSQMHPSGVGPVAFFLGMVFNLTFGSEDQKQKKMSLSQMHSSGVGPVTFFCSTILAWRAYFSLR